MVLEAGNIKDKFCSLFEKERAHRGLEEIHAFEAINEKPIYYENREKQEERKV